MNLKNKTVLITGASSGIGLACARQFAEKGARLLLCARSVDKLQQVAQQLNQEYAIDIKVFYLDVREKDLVKQSIEALPAEWKSIDILINNAGLAAGLDSVEEADIQDWEDMLDTNVKGLLYVTKAVLSGMIERDAGHIISLGSIAGHQVYPKGSVYCASKSAVNAISQGLRMDLLGKKIRVSTVDPGAVETNFSNIRFKGDEQRAASVYHGMTPLTPGDVANAIVYCASCPEHVNISEIIIMPTDQAAASMVSRRS